jgi:hypothetical protein
MTMKSELSRRSLTRKVAGSVIASAAAGAVVCLLMAMTPGGASLAGVQGRPTAQRPGETSLHAQTNGGSFADQGAWAVFATGAGAVGATMRARRSERAS